jgi:hypothetical protein
VGGAVRDAVGDAVRGAVEDAVRGAVGDAVGGAVRDAVGDAVRGAVGDAVGGAVRDAVDDAVGDAVDDAVGGAVGDAVGDAVRDAVGDAVRGAVEDAVRGAVGDAVGDAVRGAVRGAVRDAVGDAVRDAVRGLKSKRQSDALAKEIRTAIGAMLQRAWYLIIGGQFWVGGWYWGSPSYVSFMTEACGLELDPRIAAAAKAYQETAQSACWWWPHRDFVMVCERPRNIDRDARGRLHSLNGAAIAWPDGWGVYSVHGVRVPADIIEQPQLITVQRIDGEQNAEIRRVMIERYGIDRYLHDSGAEVLHEDCDQFGHPRKLVRKNRAGDEPIVAVFVRNSTLEPDGSRKDYMLRLHPELRPLLDAGNFGAPQKFTCRNAVASTFGMRGEQYEPEIET